MNEFKRALMDVAGDMSTSEKALKNAILYNQPRKKKSYIGYYLMPLFAIALLLFAGLKFIPNLMDIRQAAQPTNVYLFDLFTALEEMEWQAGIETSRANGYGEMIRTIGIPKYAQSIGVTITDADRKKVKTNLEEFWGEMDLDLAKILATANFTEKQFDENIMPFLIERAAYASKLEEKWFKDYSKMVPAIAIIYTERLGYAYMEEHYEAQLNDFKEEHNIVSYPEASSLGTSGTVVAVEDNMFLLIQNMTLIEYEQLSYRMFVDKLAAWFMNDPNNPVKVGDYVDVKAVSTSVERIGNEKVSVGLHEGIELLLPSERAHEIKEIHLSESDIPAFNELFSRADFVHPTMAKISKPPLYIVQLEGKSYTIWQNKSEQLYMKLFGDEELAKFSRYNSKKLLALFQLSETK